MTTYRPELPELPETMKKLPVARGYPVPWFVEWIKGEPEFRVSSQRKIMEAARLNLCWVCGSVLPAPGPVAFVIGPMCAINRVSSEPPSHVDCALFSARGCPFLTRPHMERREGDLPGAAVPAAGIMLKRNPGVTLVWITTAFKIESVFNGALFKVGDPIEVHAFREGRPATRDEIRESIESGLPHLRQVAEAQNGLAGLSALVAQKREAYKVLGL